MIPAGSMNQVVGLPVDGREKGRYGRVEFWKGGVVRRAWSMMLAAGPSLLVGCIPIDVPVGDGEDGQGWWSAPVSYRLAAPVWETPVSGEREYHEACLLDVLIDSGGQLVPAGWEYQGGAQGGSWSTGVEIQLNDSRETVTSLTAIRVKYFRGGGRVEAGGQGVRCLHPARPGGEQRGVPRLPAGWPGSLRGHLLPLLPHSPPSHGSGTRGRP